MSEHTPGPWFVEMPNWQTPHVWINAVGSSGVAKIETCDYGDGKGERITDEDLANARLIAAAPETAAERDRLREVNAELLAALRPLAFFSGSFRDEEDRDRLHEMFAVARAAISKATGGENG